MNIYGLYSDKRKCLMSVDFSPNGDDAEFCNETTCSLSSYASRDCLWATTDKKIADNIAETGSTPWYNSAFISPEWDEKYYGKLRVICFNEIE